jgi:hypothetical protein
MKRARRGATIVLLLFVGATVGMLIAQEVSQPDTALATDDGSAGWVDGGIATADDSVSEASSAGEPVSATDTANAADPGSEASRDGAAVSAGRPGTSTSCVVDAIYFHNTLRCATCLKIERETRAAIEAKFVDQLASGRLRWSAVNMEEHRQYVDEYGLVKPTLILARSVGDEPSDWIALDETWSLVGSETRFSLYIANGVRAFLEGCP